MQSFRSGIRTRLTTKPGVSWQRIGVLPIRSPNANAVSNGSSAVELGAHDLDERHQRRRVEEVHADDALRPRRGGRDLGDGERRGVRREHGVGPADPVELGEELPLRLELLDDRLDHEVAVGEVVELGRQRQPPDRRVARALLQLPLLDLAREEVRDPAARLLGQLERDLAADGVHARLDAELRDPGAHRAQPDDPDLSDLGHGARCYTRSTTAAIAWPKPMHMQAIP